MKEKGQVQIHQHHHRPEKGRHAWFNSSVACLSERLISISDRWGFIRAYQFSTDLHKSFENHPENSIQGNIYIACNEQWDSHFAINPALQQFVLLNTFCSICYRKLFIVGLSR